MPRRPTHEARRKGMVSSAALLSEGIHRMLPPDEYRVIYEPFAEPPDARLLHYVYRSKSSYLLGEWRRAEDRSRG